MYSLLLIWFAIFIISVIYKNLLRGFNGNRKPKKTASPWEVKTNPQKTPRHEQIESPVETLQDPVCGVYFPESEAVSRMVFGQKICFCSEKCAARYVTDQPHVRPEAHAFTA